MNISFNFNTDNIECFLNKKPNQEKHVISLSGNTLRFVPISQTSFFHRIAAWFGFGPLSLNRITHFIVEHNKAIDQQIKNPENTAAFYKNLFRKVLVYNQNLHHSCHKVQTSTLDILKVKVRKDQCSYALASKDTTYNTHANGPDGNVDFSYVNQKLGFGYVVDGAGHNNPLMQPVLKNILDEFNQSYEEAFAHQKFITIDDAKGFIESQFIELAQKVKQNGSKIEESGTLDYICTLADASYQPAMSFAQIVKINSQYHLLTLEIGDTMMLIKKADEKTGRVDIDASLVAKRLNLGLGNGTIVIRAIPISRKDTIIGFSDGIGEFLTLDECKEIISRSQPSDLLANFKSKIIQKGETFKKEDEAERGRREVLIESANKHAYVKFHTFDEDSPSYHDDISLFILTIR